MEVILLHEQNLKYILFNSSKVVFSLSVILGPNGPF